MFSVLARPCPHELDELARVRPPVVGASSSEWLAMSNDDVLRRVYALALSRGLSPAGAQGGVGLGWAESFLGVRTSNGSPTGTTQFLLSDGSPSFNVGAVTARPGQASFGGNDKGANGQPITQKWARFDSMDAGFDNWLSLGSVRAGLDALNAGDALTFAAVLYDRGYYSGVTGTREDRIRAYASMVRGAAKRVADAMGMPLLVRSDGTVPAKGAGGGSLPPSPYPKPATPAADGGSDGLVFFGVASSLAFAAFQMFKR